MRKIAITMMAMILLVSCASIVSRSKYPVSIHTQPDGVKFSIEDDRGNLVYEGTTPETVKLKSSAGFFKCASYKITFQKKGLVTRTYSLDADINGWYFGNLGFGWLLGFIVIDPLTGAMYRLPKEVNVRLKKEDLTLQINPIDKLTSQQRNKLVHIY